MADGPAALAALLLANGALVLLLRDDGLDVAFAQVVAVAAGRVGLVSGHGIGPGSGTADWPADPDLLQHGDELQAVGGLPLGQDERQRAALALADDADLAGPPASGTSEQGGPQAELASASDAPPLLPLPVARAALPVLFRRATLSAGPSPPPRRLSSRQPRRRGPGASRRHHDGLGQWWSSPGVPGPAPPDRRGWTVGRSRDERPRPPADWYASTVRWALLP